jgi:NAD(P)H-hydrate epimerase
VEVGGGNQGMTKGGTGDVFAGLAVSFLAKNEPFLAASCASYIIKKAAEELSTQKGIYYSAEDLANKIPEILAKFI